MIKVPQLKYELLHGLTTSTDTDILLKFSSRNKIHRVMCYVLRFIDGCKGNPKETGPSKSAELNIATKAICKLAQQSLFLQYFPQLKLGKPCSTRL